MNIYLILGLVVIALIVFWMISSGIGKSQAIIESKANVKDSRAGAITARSDSFAQRRIINADSKSVVRESKAEINEAKADKKVAKAGKTDARSLGIRIKSRCGRKPLLGKQKKADWMACAAGVPA